MRVHESWLISPHQLHNFNSLSSNLQQCVLLLDALSPLAHHGIKALHTPQGCSALSDGKHADVMTLAVSHALTCKLSCAKAASQPCWLDIPYTLCMVDALDTILHGQCIGYNIAWSMHWIQHCMVNVLGTILHGQCTGDMHW